MEISAFGSFNEILGALVVGTILGFTLSRSSLKNPQTLKNQLLLKDHSALKIALSSLATASIGVYIFSFFQQPKSHLINSSTPWSAFFGAGIVSIGLVMLGFCPGTCLAACAQKSKRAYFGFLGMIFGSLFYALNASWIRQSFKPQASITKATLLEALSIPHLVIIAMLLLSTLGLYLKDRKAQAL